MPQNVHYNTIDSDVLKLLRMCADTQCSLLKLLQKRCNPCIQGFESGIPCTLGYESDYLQKAVIQACSSAGSQVRCHKRLYESCGCCMPLGLLHELPKSIYA